MKKAFSNNDLVKAFAVCAGVMAWISKPAAADDPATITVRADQPGAPVAPSMYGIFFEEINHAGDGGLYAELIQNRSFDETLPVEGCTVQGDKCAAPPVPSYVAGKVKNWTVDWKPSTPWPAWSLDKPDGVDAGISIQTESPLHPANPTYLRLQVGALPPGAEVRLANEGYWGICVRDGESYHFSFFARFQKPPLSKLRVGVISGSGTVLAAEEVALDSADWKKYSGTLTAGGADPKARFFLQPLTGGSVDLDFVSLFPQRTFRNRPNGCRADVAQLLADLKPAFVRFPGGCVVEGATMENRVQWKKTIGPVHTRPGHWSLWGYRNTDGLGFFEYLQLCEDLGAQALWVINCGLSCEHRSGDAWPDEKIPELIQDVLDGIQYALGPVDSPWGKLRAEAGHSEPFPLKYIEIGNENHGPVYQARYRQFAEAIKKAWPQLTLICNEKMDGIDVEDPHFYVAPRFFFENHQKFDAAPRENAPRVYVGEYAVNRDVGGGNLLAALSEAAFMTGMERNGDLVQMCSYAPLLFHVRDVKWPVNLIGYDSAVSFGRASYYGQKLFATNRPDANVGCEVISPPLELAVRKGRIALGSWNTQAEFRDVKVTSPAGEVLWKADFAKDLGGFQKIKGEWAVVDGALRQTSPEEGARVLAGKPEWRDYTLSLKARKISGSEGFLIMFDAEERGKNWWNLGGWGNREHGVEVEGMESVRVPGHIEAGRWYDLRVELSGRRVRCYLDGLLIHDVARLSNLPSFYAVAGRKNGESLILKVVNAANKPRETKIRLQGVPSVASSATLLSLAYPDQTAENSVDEPLKIAPVESTVTVSADFVYTFPANSINVLRLTVGKP